MRKKGPLTEKPCFLFLENKNVLTSTLRDLNNSQCLDLNLPFVGNLTAMPSDAPNMQASQDAVDTKSARQGQFQEKKTKNSDKWNEYFPPGKYFRQKKLFLGNFAVFHKRFASPSYHIGALPWKLTWKKQARKFWEMNYFSEVWQEIIF